TDERFFEVFRQPFRFSFFTLRFNRDRTLPLHMRSKRSTDETRCGDTPACRERDAVTCRDDDRRVRLISTKPNPVGKNRLRRRPVFEDLFAVTRACRGSPRPLGG